MTAASKGECFRALLLRVAFSSLLLFSPAEAQLSPELSQWDHYPELPWWPEFAHMVWNSPIWTQGFEVKLMNSSTAEDAKIVAYDFLHNVTQFAGHAIDKPLLNTTRPMQLKLDCANPDYSSFLTGQPRQAGPRNIVMAFPFNAELHLLRLRLATFNDLVDQYILYEGTTGQHGAVRKPLLFEQFKHKFRPWMKKIVHIVTDDSTVVGGLGTINTSLQKGQNWANEFKARNAFYDTLTELPGTQNDDIIIYGDADEFAGEDLVFQLKHCELAAGIRMPITSNVAFFQHDFRTAFYSDWPAEPQMTFGHKCPTIWTLEALRASGGKCFRCLSNKLPHPQRYEGFHLSSPPFIPSMIFKYTGTAEYGFPGFIRPAHRNVTNWYESFKLAKKWSQRSMPARCLEALGMPAWGYPWLVRQNPEAFPFLFIGEPTWWDLEGYVCPTSAQEAAIRHAKPQKQLPRTRNSM